MKNIIKEQVQNYYLHYHTIYEDFSGLLSVKPALNEAYHITNMFTACINDIVKHIDDIQAEYTYSGWNLNNKEKVCKKYNNESVFIPIYLRISYDENDNNALSITDKSKSPNKILITFNIYFIHNNYAYDLHHELFHALQMYIVDDKNFISSQKTQIDIEQEIDIIEALHLSANMIDIFNNIICYSSPSEQDAQLQATVSFLKGKTKDRNHKLADHLIDFIDESEDYNCFYKFKFYIDKLETWWMSGGMFFNNLCIFAYFYKKYSGDKLANKINIDEEFILNLRKRSVQEKEHLAGDIFKIISDNFESYKRKLYDVVIVHCE